MFLCYFCRSYHFFCDSRKTGYSAKEAVILEFRNDLIPGKIWQNCKGPGKSINGNKGYILPLFCSLILPYPFPYSLDKMLEICYLKFWKLVLEAWYTWLTFINPINPADTRRPGDVPWRSPKGSNVRDLQGTFRGLLGDQQKKNDNLMKKVLFRCNSSCFTVLLLLFFTGKTSMQKF